MKNTNFSPKILSLTLLCFYCCSALLFSLCLFIKIAAPSFYILPISYCLTLIFIFRYIQRDILFVFLSSATIIAISVVISLRFFDTSWDGISYHLDAIRALAEGWNPIYEYAHVIYNPDNTDLWINYFPKVSWYVSTLFYKAFSDPNASKAGHLILSFSAAAYAFDLLKKSKIPTIVIFIASALVLFNPVFLTQWASNYLDSLLYSLFAISVLSAIKFPHKVDRADCICFSLAVSLLTTIKSSGVFFSFIIILVISFSLWFVPEKRKLWIKIIIVVTTMSSILGFSPYMINLMHGRNILYPLAKTNTIVKNSLEGNHPFYPKEEAEVIDIISYQSNKIATDNFNPFEQLLISIASKPTNKVEANKLPEFKKMFLPQSYEVFSTTDVRIAGWGPLFLEAFMIGLVLLFFVLSHNKIRILFSILILTIILFPASWWARYSPMVYYLPIMSALSCIFQRRNELLSILAYIVLVILIINNAIIGCVYIKENLRLSAIIKKALSPFKNKNLQICRDPRFNIDLYFSSLGIKINKVIFDKSQCVFWNNLLPYLKVDKLKDSLSAWNDIIPYLYVKEVNETINTRQKHCISYSFNYFKGLDRYYSFINKGDGLVFLTDGWASPEKDGICANGRQTNLNLIGLPWGLSVQVMVELKALVDEKMQYQHINVFVNDEFIDSLCIDECFKSYNLSIPVGVASKKDPATLSFRLPEKNSCLYTGRQLYKWKLRSIFIKLSPLKE